MSNLNDKDGDLMRDGASDDDYSEYDDVSQEVDSSEIPEKGKASAAEKEKGKVLAYDSQPDSAGGVPTGIKRTAGSTNSTVSEKDSGAGKKPRYEARQKARNELSQTKAKKNYDRVMDQARKAPVFPRFPKLKAPAATNNNNGNKGHAVSQPRKGAATAATAPTTTVGEQQDPADQQEAEEPVSEPVLEAEHAAAAAPFFFKHNRVFYICVKLHNKEVCKDVASPADIDAAEQLIHRFFRDSGLKLDPNAISRARDRNGVFVIAGEVIIRLKEAAIPSFTKVITQFSHHIGHITAKRTIQRLLGDRFCLHLVTKSLHGFGALDVLRAVSMALGHEPDCAITTRVDSIAGVAYFYCYFTDLDDALTLHHLPYVYVRKVGLSPHADRRVLSTRLAYVEFLANGFPKFTDPEYNEEQWRKHCRALGVPAGLVGRCITPKGRNNHFITAIMYVSVHRDYAELVFTATWMMNDREIVLKVVNE